MTDLRVETSAPLNGSISLPGDKSISHRAAILLALSKGAANIENFATGDDCLSTLNCLSDMGVPISRQGASIRMGGLGKSGLSQPADPLQCGNSGTTMRLLAGLLAGQKFDSVLTGDASLESRPMKRITAPLLEMNCPIAMSNGRAPLEITGQRELKGISYELPVASAQVKSCILLAGLNASDKVVLKMPEAPNAAPVARDHTERMMRYLGMGVESEFIPVEGGFREVITLDPALGDLLARDIDVPGDISTAAFFLIAAAGIKGSDVELKNIGLNETRFGIVEILQECGIRLTITNRKNVNNEPRGDLRVSWDGACELIKTPLVIGGSRLAGVIDEVPALAVLGTLLPGGIEIRDAAELRVKESDRIASIVTNLRAMGASVEEFDDGMRVLKSSLTGGEIQSFGDHRIAMAFAVAARFAEGASLLKGTDCVSVSFPGFFDELEGLTIND